MAKEQKIAGVGVTAPAAAGTAGAIQPVVLEFVKEKETKNTVRYQEVERPGQPPVIGTLYVQKWAVNGAERLTVTMATATSS